MVSYVDVTNAQVAAGAAVTTALMAALRDNPEGIAQRAAGAPKIFGVAYDYQEFTSSGTWIKPTAAEAGDRVIVQVVAGGGSGKRGVSGSINLAYGGVGGAGIISAFDIGDLAATEAVAVGAGGAAQTSAGANGVAGGDSTFGTTGSPVYIECEGGAGGSSSSDTTFSDARIWDTFVDALITKDTGNRLAFSGGAAADGSPSTATGASSIFGGGGGGSANTNSSYSNFPGMSVYAGNGGIGRVNAGTASIDGMFPGGGGGGTEDTNSGAGGDGVVRVWCIKEG